jgi:hypothetical protein
MDSDARDASHHDDALFENEEARPRAVPPAALSADARERLQRQRAEVSGQVGGASGEIERLRMRQAELEREKQDLQELARKQEAYERDKRDIVEKLSGRLQLLEKEKAQALRMVELLGETHERFAEHLTELGRIREDAWEGDRFKEELDAAAVAVAAAQTIYRKGLARLEATRWHRGGNGRGVADPDAEPSAGQPWPRGFGFWFKAGLAFGLPLIFALIVLFLIHLHTSGVFATF